MTSAAQSTVEPDVFRTVLPNGLRAIVRERPDTDVVAISVATRGGSRDERRETVGAAHFMEHMFFQGTPRRPDSADLDREIEARGGWTNAWTGWESINFQVVAADRRPRPGDRRHRRPDGQLAVRPGEDRQGAPGRPRRAERPAEQPGRPRRTTCSGSRCSATIPARNLPIGNRATIDQSTREVLVAFRDTYFVASNMVVAVVGDVQHEESSRSWRRVRGHADRRRSRRRTPPRSRRWSSECRRTSRPASRRRLIAGGPTVGYDSPDRHVLDVIEAILGDVRAAAWSASSSTPRRSPRRRTPFYYPADRRRRLGDLGRLPGPPTSTACSTWRRRSSGCCASRPWRRRSSTRRRRTCAVSG